MELIIFTIPFLLISAISGQNDTEAIVLTEAGNLMAEQDDTISNMCSLRKDLPGANSDKTVYKWFDKKGKEINNTEASKSNRLVIRSFPGEGLLLMINNVQEEDSGVYRCNISNPEDQRDDPYTATFNLKVTETIQFVDCPASQNVLMGADSLVSCRISTSKVVKTWWEKDGKMVNFNDPRYRADGTKGLFITGINDSDAGYYKYVAFKGKETKAQPIVVDIVVGPRIVSPISEKTAVAGEKHEMFCKADGRPLPDIFWYKEGTANALETSDGGRIKVDEKEEDGKKQGILTFDPVMKEDAATYTCKAVGEKLNSQDDNAKPLENSTSAFMTVLVRPTVEDMPTVEKSENEGATLTCITRGDPKPSAIWQKVGTDIQYSSGSQVEGITVVETSIDDPNNPGTQIQLIFTSLQSSNGGDYKCIAKNTAGDAEGIINLRVLYKPTFDDQEAGPFYTWMGYDQGYIPCTARSDPTSTFRWFKVTESGDVEISNADQSYTIERDEDDDDEFKVTSKLLVSFDGQNRAVFGAYKCLAKNKVGEEEQELSIQEGLVPGAPLVSENNIFAQKIVLWVYDQPVQGPEVKQYKIKYGPQNGAPEDMLTIFRPKETRIFTDDKSGTPKTEVVIEGLEARTTYDFYVHAINLVGEGAERVTTLTTKSLSEPKVVNILKNTESNSPTEIFVVWQEPDNGGLPILEYHLSYAEVAVMVPNNGSINPQQGYEFKNKIGDDIEIGGITTTQYKLTNGIGPGRYYMVEVKAINGIGPGPAGKIIVKTRDGPQQPIDGAPRLVSVSTTVTLFGCLAALSACLKSFM